MSSQRLVWSEGMLLSPQHLQALDRFQEALVGARVGAVAPLDWGVLSMEIDQGALAAGQLRLVRFSGVMPDGLPLSFEDAESAPRPRDVADRLPPSARALDVHLAVPRERDGVPSYADAATASPSRYLAVTRSVQDATAPGAPVEVRFARPNALLLLGDEERGDHEIIKIAEVVRGAAGAIALSDTYVPPCLRLSAAPALLSGVREVLARCIAKARELSETRRHRDAASEITAPDLVRLLQLLVLNAQTPVLSHLAEGAATPRECYLALAALVGQLLTFRGEDPTSLPKFQHTDLRSTFEPLLARTVDLLGGLARQQYVAIPLEKRGGGLFLARIADEKLLGGQVFLTVKSEQPESTVVEQLPRLCKIASASEIQGLVQAAAPGLPLQIVHRPPPQLPVAPGVVYFLLTPGDRYWQGIVSHRNVAVYLPPPFDPARTVLQMLAIPGDPTGRSAAR